MRKARLARHLREVPTAFLGVREALRALYSRDLSRSRFRVHATLLGVCEPFWYYRGALFVIQSKVSACAAAAEGSAAMEYRGAITCPS